MKILVGCEESQAVTIAFRNKGHEAYSCDLQECSGGRPEWHLRMDCFKAYEIIKPELVIGHPPCQYITNAGIGYFNLEKYGDKAVERWAKRKEASELFMKMWNLPVKKMCLENPVGFINSFMPASQVIHPYMFGDAHKKRTCLWLRGLPLLSWTKEDNLFGAASSIGEPAPLAIQYRKPSKYYVGGEVKKRYFTDVGTKDSKRRSKTFPGIAKAMADQWG